METAIKVLRIPSDALTDRRAATPLARDERLSEETFGRLRSLLMVVGGSS
jgi:hypothetical protein